MNTSSHRCGNLTCGEVKNIKQEYSTDEVRLDNRPERKTSQKPARHSIVPDCDLSNQI